MIATAVVFWSQLCDFVLNNAGRPSLLRVALATLSKFLSWIPVQYVFETNLLEILCLKFLPNPAFRLHAMEVCNHSAVVVTL